MTRTNSPGAPIRVPGGANAIVLGTDPAHTAAHLNDEVPEEGTAQSWHSLLVETLIGWGAVHEMIYE